MKLSSKPEESDISIENNKGFPLSTEDILKIMEDAVYIKAEREIIGIRINGLSTREELREDFLKKYGEEDNYTPWDKGDKKDRICHYTIFYKKPANQNDKSQLNTYVNLGHETNDRITHTELERTTQRTRKNVAHAMPD